VQSAESIAAAFDKAEAALGTARRPGQQRRHLDREAGPRYAGSRLGRGRRHQPARRLADGADRRRSAGWRPKRPGAIVNIASILGLRTIGQVAPYNASKAGLIHLTRALAMEWARYRIRVNAICPGYIETEMNGDFWKTPGGQRLIDRIPQRRIGQPEHLDGALLLLASEAGAFMTGSVITVDGGHTVSSL
jgi:NAD(P)-dependent dehydrogenase (short-subunit alcohol dehydrogenase family)